MSAAAAARGERRREDGRIAVLHLLPDLSPGGGQQVVLRHVAALDAQAFAHHVAWFHPARELAGAFGAAGAVPHDLSPWRWRTARAVLRRLGALVERERIDVLHCHGTPVDKLHAQLAAWRHGRPLVWTLHGLRPLAGRPSLRPRVLSARLRAALARRAGAWLDRRALDAVVAVSQVVLDDWRTHLDAVAHNQAARLVIPSGVPLGDFRLPPDSRPRVRAALGLDPEALVLLCVSRLQASKRVDRLLPVLAEVRRTIPGAVLLLAGEGPERTALHAAAHARGLDAAVRLLGYRPDVPALLAAADLLLFPSTREGFGLVVLEAMAAAVPVLSTPLPSLAALREDGAPIHWVDFADARATAAEVLGLREDPVRARSEGEALRKLATERWSVARSAAAYADLYRRLAAGGRRDAPPQPERAPRAVPSRPTDPCAAR